MSGETSQQAHIGPYRLLSRLGDGGAVHRAADPDGRDVAIRLLPPGAAPDIERMREVLSPYVVDVLDGEPTGPRPYIVSRFVPGRPLAETVAERGPMSGDALRRVASGLAKALAAVHRTGLVHGRLGPETVLVVDDAPVMVDFALTAGAGAAADVRAWAATVTFAATGRPDAPADALPTALRPLVEAAAYPDPSVRPTAEALAEAASHLTLPPIPAARPPTERPTDLATPVSPAAPDPPAIPAARPPVEPPTDAAEPGAVGAVVPGGGGRRRDVTAPEMRVPVGWARLLTALVVVIAVAVAVIAPVAGLVVSLAAVTLLRLAGTPPGDGMQGRAGAVGRTLLTVPYAAVFTAAVPLVLVAAAAAGGRIDSLRACAFGAGAGAAALWAAPGVDAPRRGLERMLLPLARRPRLVGAAAAGLGVLALLAGVGAMTLDPSFAPLYGLQQMLERSLDRLQHAVSGL